MSQKEGKNLDNILLLLLTKRLLKPWTEWDAYKRGLIDENGKEIRKPGYDKSGEKLVIGTEIARDNDAWSTLNKFLAKLKKQLKDGQIQALSTYFTLIKEDTEEDQFDRSVILEGINYKKKMKVLESKVERVILESDANLDEYIEYLLKYKLTGDEDDI